jgi:hypothetical protein
VIITTTFSSCSHFINSQSFTKPFSHILTRLNYQSPLSSISYFQFVIMGLLSQPTIPPLSSSASLQSQTILITGATGGIGYELSLQILQLGATDLILAVRSLQKGFAARLEMLGRFPQANIRVYELDLSDYSSVRECAARIVREEKKLDVLILNAGINLAHFEKSASGNERYVQSLTKRLFSASFHPLIPSSLRSFTRSAFPFSLLYWSRELRTTLNKESCKSTFSPTLTSPSSFCPS